MDLEALPITGVLPELIIALRGAAGVVLQAPTGAGKTTRVPSAIWQAGLAGGRLILLLEPRRLAARAAARRIAQELRVTLGEEVGYQVRFDSRCSHRTQILVVTEGILLRKLQADPFLEDIGCVLFDEFHERNLAADLALAMSRRIQQTVRPDLKLVVMSATLDPAPIATYLGDVPVVISAGRSFPVDMHYARPGLKVPQHEAIVQGVRDLLPMTSGDLLVFVPRVRDIHRVITSLNNQSWDEPLLSLPLYGDLTYEQQERVFQPTSQRKVIVSTNVAETSLTIPGVTGVLDTGLVQQSQYSVATGLNRLELQRISQASATQRAGRAGRTQPGVCLRLWPEREQHGLPLVTPPEIERIDLSGAVLELLCWGETDLAAFPWFEAPPAVALERARDTLTQLGAIQHGLPTALGQQLVQIPAEPRLARVLIEGHRLGRADLAAWACALLSERDPFRAERSVPGHHSWCDVTDRIQVLLECSAHSGSLTTPYGSISTGDVHSLRSAQQQLLRVVTEVCGPAPRSLCESASVVPRALLAGFPDRVVCRRDRHGRTGVMVGGRGVSLLESSRVLEPELFLAVNADEAFKEIRAHWASGLERDWLPAGEVVSGVEAEFDPETEQIRAWHRTRYRDLLLSEAATSAPANFDWSAAIAQAASRDLTRVLPLDHPPVEQFLARLRCLRAWMPDLNLPTVSDADLCELLPRLARGCRSFADLRRAPWLAALQGLLDYPQLQALDREAPEKLLVPSGSRIALLYAADAPPVLAVRIQELFGWAETPRIARGRIPVVLHLLGPNYRPQQITSDLRSFWDNTYPEVRKELRRRYPKHSWPEDPWNAEAQRKGPSQRQ